MTYLVHFLFPRRVVLTSQLTQLLKCQDTCNLQAMVNVHSPGVLGVWRGGEVGSQDVLLLPLVACPTLAGSGRAAGETSSKAGSLLCKCPFVIIHGKVSWFCVYSTSFTFQ